MTNILLVAISAAVSLAADIMVDCYLLKKHRINSEEYKTSLKFARNNKNIKNYQNVFEDMYQKISALEEQLSASSYNSKAKTYDDSELRKEIAALKRAIQNIQALGNNKENSEQLVHTLNELGKRISALEQKSSASSPVPVDTKALDQKLERLNAEIAQLKSTLNALNQPSSANDRLESLVNQMSNEIMSLKQTVAAQQQLIETLQNKKTAPTSAPTVVTFTAPPASVKTEVSISSPIITPDENYVKMLISGLSALEGNLGQTEYKHFEKGLQDLLKNGDFDDGEEIMEEVHRLIEKYIYGSDTKVSGKQWAVLEKHLETAGYTPVPVKIGDDVTPYRTYFNRPIPAEGGIPNTIKQITLMPYVVTFEDRGEKETLKLCGKCIYYK